MKEPIYILDYKIALAEVTININDINAVTFNHGTTIYSNQPINHLILKSGIQTISIIINNNKKNQSNDHTEVEVKILVYDASLQDYNDAKVIFEDKIVKEKTDKYHKIYNNYFEVEVPYNLEGWSNGDVFDIEDDYKIVSDFYKKIYSLFKMKRTKEIIKILETRYLETDVSLYITENNLIKLEDLFQTLNHDYQIEEFPDTKKLKLYGNGKVATLIRQDLNPIIYYKNTERNEEFGFPIYVMKKNDEIVVIR